jgi:hypothetical protein
MSDTFQQEVETQEKFDQLSRIIIKAEGVHEKLIDHIPQREIKNLQLLVTFNPDFQMKIDIYCGPRLYGKNHERLVFGWPWFSVMGQEETYKLWTRIC